jgi:hypothetical protein
MAAADVEEDHAPVFGCHPQSHPSVGSRKPQPQGEALLTTAPAEREILPARPLIAMSTGGSRSGLPADHQGGAVHGPTSSGQRHVARGVRLTIAGSGKITIE